MTTHAAATEQMSHPCPPLAPGATLWERISALYRCLLAMVAMIRCEGASDERADTD